MDSRCQLCPRPVTVGKWPLPTAGSKDRQHSQGRSFPTRGTQRLSELLRAAWASALVREPGKAGRRRDSIQYGADNPLAPNLIQGPIDQVPRGNASANYHHDTVQVTGEGTGMLFIHRRKINQDQVI